MSCLSFSAALRPILSKTGAGCFQNFEGIEASSVMTRPGATDDSEIVPAGVSCFLISATVSAFAKSARRNSFRCEIRSLRSCRALIFVIDLVCHPGKVSGEMFSRGSFEFCSSVNRKVLLI